MSRKILSRRCALGLIAKTGATLGAGTCFFLTLKTRPLAAAPLCPPFEGRMRQKVNRPGINKADAENVVISGAGSALIVKIAGATGRHCGLAYAVIDADKSYKAVPGGRGVISSDGLCIIRVDVRKLPNRKVFLRVVTGNTRAFDDDFAGTEVFVVNIAGGAISGFEGVQSRPLINARGGEKGLSAVASSASSAAVGFGKKRR